MEGFGGMSQGFTMEGFGGVASIPTIGELKIGATMVGLVIGWCGTGTSQSTIQP